MFERYTEKARRVIFFGRYEASLVGSPYIETEHLLLGLLREDKTIANRFIRSRMAVESVRKQIESRITRGEPVSTSVDLPLSHESKRVLAYAAEEAQRLSHKHIGMDHLLLGLLREEKCLAAEILLERGLQLSQVREEIARSGGESGSQQIPAESSLISRFSVDLTEAAADCQLSPGIARDRELDLILETLCRKARKNPVLSGEPAIARSIVETIARRIAEGAVPSSLGDKRIVACDVSKLEAESSSRAQFRELWKRLVEELNETPNTIVFIEELNQLLTPLSNDGWLDCIRLMSSQLFSGTMQIVAATASSTYGAFVQRHKLLAGRFEEIVLAPLDEAECKLALGPLTLELQTFHGVTFQEDAISAAMAYAKEGLPEHPILTRASDILDQAAARVRIQKEQVPEDLRDVQTRLRFITQRMENAIAHHEFDKAKLYSSEEQKERENLDCLQEKYNVGRSSAALNVTGADVAAVITLWSRYPES